MTRIGVLGLGKLGLPLALTLSQHANNSVAVWDNDEDVRNSFSKKESHINEPLVDTMLKTTTSITLVHPSRMNLTEDIIFIVTPTPSLPDGSFDSSYVAQAIRSLDLPETGGPIIAVMSTLSPGSCRKLSPLIAPGKLVYTPIIIALGTVVYDLRNPELHIIGGSNSITINDTANVLLTLCQTAKQHFMSYESAELTKLSANAFATMKIGFTNTVAQMCDLYPGANIEEISAALSIHKRIGPWCMTAGAGFGGPCLPRDTHAFSAAGGTLFGDNSDLINNDHVIWIVRKMIRASNVAPTLDRTFMVMGTTYKEGSDYEIESFGNKIAEFFTSLGLSAVDSSTDADFVVISQPMRKTTFEYFKEGAVVMDLWRSHKYLINNEHITYIPFGIGE